MKRPVNKKLRDQRIHKILDQLIKYCEGDYDNYIGISDAVDEIDAISAALNTFGEVLKNNSAEIRNKEKRINDLLDILLNYTVMDFSAKAGITGNGDDIDALGAGLNALGEELVYNTTMLKESEEQIKTIFKNAPDAVVVMDSRATIVRWNPAAQIVFGWSEDEVIGKFLHDVLIPERYRERHMHGLSNFLETGEGQMLNKSIQLPALRKDSSEVEMELTISPARINNDYIFISFLRDITERKKAETKINQLNATLEQRVVERTSALQQSEKKYRNLFENNPMPLWILDLQTLKFLDVNEAAISHYGYSREEFLSMTAVNIRPEEDKEQFLGLNRNVGAMDRGVWRHLKKDGTIIYSDVSAHHIIFEGKPARLVLSNDVTERKKAQEALIYSEARFRRIFDSKLIGFLFWDAERNITEGNDLFLEIIGYTREDLNECKINIQDITPPEYAELDRQAIEQINATGVCEPVEKEYLRKDGGRVPVLVGAAALGEGFQNKNVSYIMDITSRKKMREEILELNRDLEARVVKRTEELQYANKELESFSYSVSHDLRSPLRAIHGYSQMIIEDYAPKLDSEGQRLLNNVMLNAKKMGQLVDDLLEFSRMGKRALSLSHTDMNQVVEDVLQELNQTSVNRAKITLHPLGKANADFTLLRHVFQNLLSNAIKYSSKKENPEIEIGVKYTEGSKTYFVKDNGAGFDMAYYNKLFGVFQRLHQEEFEGTGVGLAIVQRIVQRHGGKVWAEAKVNEGATFYFTLPNSNLI